MSKTLHFDLETRIEVARPSHLEAMCAISKMTTPKWHRRPYLKQSIREKRVLVALIHGRIPGGFLIWTKDFYGHYFIDLLIIHPDVHRQGAASGLIHYMEKISKGHKLFTSTNRSNKKMQKVMAKHGYIRAGVITHLDRGDPEWIYYKKV